MGRKPQLIWTLDRKNLHSVNNFMGATGWNYFVPYETDISAALQRLREDIFARGNYVWGDGLTPKQHDSTVKRMRPHIEAWVSNLMKDAENPKLSERERTIRRMGAEQIRKKWEIEEKSKPKVTKKPKTIEDLLNQQAENGTHSILDITCISPKPKFGAINPFPNSRLLEFFDSETPSRTNIEEVFESGSLERFISRWQGFYIIAYCNGRPSEIFFAGCSGD